MEKSKPKRQPRHHEDKAIQKVMAAHGGADKWLNTDQLIARVSLGGLNYLRHFRMEPLKDLMVHVSTKEPRVSMSPFLREGHVGVFEMDSVRIETESGEVVRQRDNPNNLISNLTRTVYYDDLDLLYSVGQQIWCAMVIPFVLIMEGVTAMPLDPIHDGLTTITRMQVELPEQYPSSAMRQVYGFDATGLLRRVEYTNRAFPWDSVIHVCEQHESFDGLVVATKRRIHPNVFGVTPWRMMTLGWFDLEDISVI